LNDGTANQKISRIRKFFVIAHARSGVTVAGGRAGEQQ
jgi:hypothetical protein